MTYRLTILGLPRLTITAIISIKASITAIIPIISDTLGNSIAVAIVPNVRQPIAVVTRMGIQLIVTHICNLHDHRCI